MTFIMWIYSQCQYCYSLHQDYNTCWACYTDDIVVKALEENNVNWNRLLWVTGEL